LELATNSTFENKLFVKTQISEENYHLTDINLDNGIYYWRVRVEDEYLAGNLQNALPELYSPVGNFEIHLPKQAGISVINDPNTQGIPSDVIVSIYDEEGSVYTGAYWVKYDQINRNKTLELKYTPITVHFEAYTENGKKVRNGVILPPDYTFTEGSCVHLFENGIVFTEPGTYSISISVSGEGINIPSVSHSGIKVAPKGITPDHFHVVDILDPINAGSSSNVSLVVHDADCNLVIEYSGSVYFSSTDPAADLPQTYTFTTADYGVHTFVDGVILNTPGSQTVFAIDVDNPQITGSQTVYVKGVEDTIPPTILHKSITSAPAGLPMTIVATITDNVSVAEAILYWKIGGGKVSSTNMVNIGDDVYEAIIPEDDVTMRGLLYAIWATDGKNSTLSTIWTTLTYGTVTSPMLGAVYPTYKSISVPVHPHNPEPANVLYNFGNFEQNVRLVHFDGTNWVIHNPPASSVPDFAPEVGYGITSDVDRQIIVAGTSTNPAGYYVIPLTGGQWNHIGHPYLYRVAFDANVKFRKDDEIKDPVDAYLSGWIQSSLWYYDGTGFKEVPYPGVIEPWVGYFILAGENCEMLIPAEEVGSKGESNCPVKEWRESKKVRKGNLFGIEDMTGFTIQLTAKMGSLTDKFDFGRKYHKPPKLLIDTTIFTPSGIRFNLSSESKNNEGQIYEFVIERWGDIKDVEINWNIDKISQQYYFYLKDNEDNKLIDISKTDFYKYTSIEQKRQFSLIISTKPFLSASLVEYCYPNPAKEKVYFKVPKNKPIKLKIFNIAGELVYKDKQNSGDSGVVEWNCKNKQGDTVASGIYIYILKDLATGDVKTGKIGVIR
jgi:hypothetical protein